MSPRDVLKVFGEKHPNISERIRTWFPNGKNCVRVRLDCGQELVFTYVSTDDWMLESTSSYIRRTREVRRM